MQNLETVLDKQFPKSNVDFSTRTFGINTIGDRDSLAHFNLLVLVENEFGIQFKDEEMDEIKNTSRIRAALIKHETQC